MDRSTYYKSAETLHLYFTYKNDLGQVVISGRFRVYPIILTIKEKYLLILTISMM